jgi:hypothetical protein
MAELLMARPAKSVASRLRRRRASVTSGVRVIERIEKTDFGGVFFMRAITVRYYLTVAGHARIRGGGFQPCARI